MATVASVNTEVLTSLRLCGDEDRDVFAVNIDAPKQLSILTNHEPNWGYSDIYLYQLTASRWSTAAWTLISARPSRHWFKRMASITSRSSP